MNAVAALTLVIDALTSLHVHYMTGHQEYLRGDQEIGGIIVSWTGYVN